MFPGREFVLKVHPTEDHTAGCSASGQQVLRLDSYFNILLQMCMDPTVHSGYLGFVSGRESPDPELGAEMYT